MCIVLNGMRIARIFLFNIVYKMQFLQIVQNEGVSYNNNNNKFFHV